MLEYDLRILVPVCRRYRGTVSPFRSLSGLLAMPFRAASTAVRRRWKLNWFLRDFGYDAELLERDEVDEKQLVGLRGVIKISHIAFNGSSN
jgi:hypothetical protein